MCIKDVVGQLHGLLSTWNPQVINVKISGEGDDVW